MTKYNFHDIKNELHRYAINRAFGLLLKDGREKAIKSQDIDIALAFNGEDIDFLDFVDGFFAQIEGLAEERAQNIVWEKVREPMDALSDIQDFINDKLRIIGCERS